MSVKSEAWFLYARKPGEAREANLVRREIDVPAPGEDEVQVEPMFGSWEGNMGHAIARNPIDVCRQRGEERVVLGNSGVLRIAAVGRNVRHLREGQYAICSNIGSPDRWGYPMRIFAYDAPGTVGCLAKRFNLHERLVVPIPEKSRHRLEQWAAFSLRYVTAWSNWELAHGVLRLLIEREELRQPYVWGWGGGTTLAELTLAARAGCHTVMLSGNPQHRALIQRHGIEALDRKKFGDLQFKEDLYISDPAYRRGYDQAEALFLDEVVRKTEGERVHIFVDYIGGPVLRATLKALSREGVITTAGWRQGMVTTYLRAVECIARHQHIHTHHARRKQCEAAVAYAEAEGWMPIVEGKVYAFDEVPELAKDFLSGVTDIFPMYAVNAV